MEAQQATTEADSDDDYLDDVVVRAATERLKREFDDRDGVYYVGAERFEVLDEMSDWIELRFDQDAVNDWGMANILQDAIDTGVVEIHKVKQESGRLTFAPTEKQRTGV